MKVIYNYLKRYKKIVIGISILIVFAILLISNIFMSTTNEVSAETEIEEKVVEVKEEVVLEKQYVEIKGAVINPGVYEIASNNRVIDIIEISGGLTDKADTSIISLSKKIKDEDVIIIYTKNEIKNLNEKEPTIYSCECPDNINTACLNDSNNTIDKYTESTKTSISINNATSEQLQTLSGIGASKANSIIEYRNTNGPFTKIEDIMEIGGIGESIFNKIKDNITL